MNKTTVIFILSAIALILFVLVINKPNYHPSKEQIKKDLQNITVTSVSVDTAEDNNYPKVVIKGELPNDCISVSDASINLSNDIFYINLKPMQSKQSCHNRKEPFSLTLPIDTTGLAKGTYQIKVGDKQAKLELSKNMLKIEDLKNEKVPTN